MALVVFLRGVNVGGHRTFRPSVLAKQLSHFDAVNIGAAGTFVIRKSVSQAMLRAELKRRLPFETEVMICNGRDLVRMEASDPFAGRPSSATIVRFVSVLAKRGRAPIRTPLNVPSVGRWGLKVLACRGRFVFGLFRREMKAIGYLGQLDKMFGMPVTTRQWSTILSIVQVLKRT